MDVTLLSFDVQGVLEDALEDTLDVVEVLFLGLQENQDVIKVGKDELVHHV